MRSRRKFNKEFKVDAVQRLRAGEPVGLLARSLEVSRQELYRWSRDLEEFGERAFPGVGRKRAEGSRIAELERKIGQQVLEVDFLNRALQHVEQQRQPLAASGGALFTNRSSEKLKAGTLLTIRRMCRLAGVSGAGFYGCGVVSGPAAVGLRDPVQRVALEWPTYGSRRITVELCRCGVPVNRKRVQRVVREDNLLCLRKRKFVATTDSAHGLKVYPNLAAALVVSGINQLWRADITYIRLLEEFIYLAVVLDAFSRRAIGWALEGTLEAKLAMAALDMALERRRHAPGLVHHSDQGAAVIHGTTRPASRS
jgi:transposase-like protein